MSSTKFPIAYIQIKVFSHATEDPEKVKKAVCNILPEDLTTDIIFDQRTLPGHHGNPITFFEIKITNKPRLLDVLTKFSNLINSIDKQTLTNQIKQHVDKRNFYLRLNKQNAYSGSIKLSTIDPIRFKIHFKNKTSLEIIDFLKDLGLIESVT